MSRMRLLRLSQLNGNLNVASLRLQTRIEITRWNVRLEIADYVPETGGQINRL